MTRIACLGVLLSACAVVGGESRPHQQPMLTCVVRLNVPHYPPLARFARLGGLALTEVEIGKNGGTSRIKVAGVHPVLAGEIEARMRASRFRADCEGKSVHLLFNFTIEGEATEESVSAEVVFEPPHTFVISIRPQVPLPQ